jgi:hypothetical protein
MNHDEEKDAKEDDDRNGIDDEIEPLMCHLRPR